MNIDPSTRGLLTVLFRQKGKILLVFLLIMTGITGYLIKAHPMYESTGSILVKFGREAMPDLSDKNTRPEELAQNDRRETIESYMDILRSHDLVQEVVNEFTPDKIYPDITNRVKNTDSPVEATIRDIIKGDLTVKAAQQSNVIEVTFANTDPKLAAAFVSRLIEVFIARQTEVYNNPQIKILKEQMESAGNKLSESQNRLQDFKSKIGVSSIDEELSRLIQQKGEAETITFQALGDAQTKLTELKAKEAELLSTYQPDSLPVQQIRQSIAAAQRIIAERKSDMRPSGDIISDSSDENGKPKKGILGAHMADVNNRIEELEKQRKQYNDLDRTVKIDEDNYKNYVKHYEDARISETLNDKKVTRLSIVDKPIEQVKPARPKKAIIVGAGFLIALILSLGTGLIAETFDERFSSPEQIFPVLNVQLLASFSKKG